MNSNAGTLDRIVRLALGAALIGLAATGNVGAWGYVGVIPVLTGLVGYCPLYSILGINTCPVRN